MHKTQHKTQHLQTRMNQRGINSEMIELAIQFGVMEGDKMILDEKQLKSLISKLDQVRTRAIRALDKGGIVVVSSPEDGSLITTYTVNSYRGKGH